MKVRDLLSMEIDIDVYDDVCEELGIAFCGPMEVTEAGMKVFGEVLDYDCDKLDPPLWIRVRVRYRPCGRGELET